MRVLDWEQVEDVLLGCAVLATGGGGQLRNGLRWARACFEEFGPIQLAALDELASDEIVACPYFVGAVKPGEEGLPGEGSLRDVKAALEKYEPLMAMRAIERYLRREVAAVIPAELGGGNTAVAFVVAWAMNRPVVDADPVGRAVPELIHSTFYLDGMPFGLMALASRFGDVVIAERVADDFRAEAIARAFAVASGDSAGAVDHPIPVSLARESLLPGTITRAGNIGFAVRTARREGKDVAAAVARAGGGLVIFRGIVACDSTFEIKGGLTEGRVTIRGAGCYAERTAELMFRNEHMVAWVDGVVVATVPDLVAILDEKSGEPVLNPAIPAGRQVAVLVFPAPAKWRTPRGLEVFGPRYAGVDAPYVPVEERCRAHGLGESEGGGF